MILNLINFCSALLLVE